MDEFEVHIAVNATVRIIVDAVDADDAEVKAEKEFFKHFNRYKREEIATDACRVEDVVHLEELEDEE